MNEHFEIGTTLQNIALKLTKHEGLPVQTLTNKMVGCCNIGPCKKKRTYEFNNPGYQSNKTDAGTYRQSQLFDDDGEETKANGDAKLEGYASRSGGSLDGDSGHDSAIKGVVAVELDSDTEDSQGRKNSQKGRKDSKRSSKKSSSSCKSSKRSSKHSDDDGGDRKAESGFTSVETSVIRVTGTRNSAHDSEGAERSSKASENTEAGAVPYPDDNAEHTTTTTTTTTYTSLITHRVDGDNDGDDDSVKRNSNISQSSSNRNVISAYDLSDEGHFHSEHQYTVQLTPGKRTSTTSEDDSRRMTQEYGSDVGSIATERSSVLVNVPTEAEGFDNVANKLTQDLRDEDEERHTVTEVTETVIHINSPIEIGDDHRYSSSDFAM